MSVSSSVSVCVPAREEAATIGKIVREQVALYGTLTGEHQAVRVDEPPAPDAALGDNVLSLPKRSARSRRQVPGPPTLQSSDVVGVLAELEHRGPPHRTLVPMP